MDKCLGSFMPQMYAWKHIQPCLSQARQQVPVQHLPVTHLDQQHHSSPVYFPALFWMGGGGHFLSLPPPS